MEGKCGICGVQCSKLCSNCKKVYYCSTEHQKKDRKIHKQICFPATLSFDEIQGRHFIATRNILPGERIFTEKALVVGPNGAEKYFHEICLGCYRCVRTNYTCSKCQWPVCNAQCEKLSPHSEMECKIFSEKKILPFFTKPYEYDFIKFLRSLLLRDTDEKKWDQLLGLASHAEARAECESAILATMASVEFVRDTCLLDQFDYDTVNHVVGVWGVNSFGANAPSGPNPQGRLASFLFAKTSLCSHSCVANTRGILMEEEERMKQDGGDEVTKPVFSMQLLASLRIEEGQPILITYADVSEGTFERRRILQDHYYFSCDCSRCSDPGEFNTNFSAFKCPECTFGYLLPENPLNFNSDWICDCATDVTVDTSCNGRNNGLNDLQSETGIQPQKQRSQKSNSSSIRSNSNNSDCSRGSSESESGSSTSICTSGGRKYVELVGIINKIKYKLNSIGTASPETEIKQLENILRENSGTTLHRNHWILMEVTFRLVQRLICYMPEAKNVHSVIKKCISLSEHCLHVADFIRPGHNPYRGKLLYCCGQAKLQEVVRSSGMDIIEKRTNLSQLKSSLEESRQILVKEPPKSDERVIAESLIEDLKQVNRIISVLDGKIRNGK